MAGACSGRDRKWLPLPRSWKGLNSCVLLRECAVHLEDSLASPQTFTVQLSFDPPSLFQEKWKDRQKLGREYKKQKDPST